MEITVSLTDLLKIIAGISIVIILIYLIPLMIQLRRTAAQAEKLINNLNRDLPTILESLKGTTSEIRTLSEHINVKIAETDAIITTAKYAGETLLLTSNLIKTALVPAICKIEGVSSAIKSFYNFITGQKSKKTKETQSHE